MDRQEREALDRVKSYIGLLVGFLTECADLLASGNDPMQVCAALRGYASALKACQADNRNERKAHAPQTDVCQNPEVIQLGRAKGTWDEEA